MTTLCKNLGLSIELDETREGEQIRMVLVNDMTLEQVIICCDVGKNTNNRRYHRREAMVIAMRRLILEAVKEGLISDSRGVSLDLSSMLG